MKVAVALAWHLKPQGICRKGGYFAKTTFGKSLTVTFIIVKLAASTLGTLQKKRKNSHLAMMLLMHCPLTYYYVLFALSCTAIVCSMLMEHVKLEKKREKKKAHIDIQSASIVVKGPVSNCSFASLLLTITL